MLKRVIKKGGRFMKEIIKKEVEVVRVKKEVFTDLLETINKDSLNKKFCGSVIMWVGLGIGISMIGLGLQMQLEKRGYNMFKKIIKRGRKIMKDITNNQVEIIKARKEAAIELKDAILNDLSSNVILACTFTGIAAGFWINILISRKGC